MVMVRLMGKAVVTKEEEEVGACGQEDRALNSNDLGLDSQYWS